MNPTVLERLPDLLIENLSPDDTQQRADLLAQSPELARELAIVHETMALREAVLRPVQPSARARERLVAALFGVDRFRPFVDRLCRMVDLSDEAVRDLLARIDDATAWEPGPLPSIKVMHFDHGPALLSAETGLVRLAAGQAVPRHRHVGAEVSFVLEGTLWEGDTCYFPGQAVPQPAGSVHTFTAGAERDLVFAVSHCGIEFM